MEKETCFTNNLRYTRYALRCNNAHMEGKTSFAQSHHAEMTVFLTVQDKEIII